MTVRIRHGDSYAEISGELEGQIRAAVRRASGDVLAVIEDETSRLFRQARDLMPVRTGATRAALRQMVEITTDGVVRGRVIAPRHARYILSWQIAGRTQRLNPGTVALLRQRGVPHPQQKLDRAKRLAISLGVDGKRAAERGSVRWLLLGYPEKHAGKQLEVILGPVIERALSGELEG